MITSTLLVVVLAVVLVAGLLGGVTGWRLSRRHRAAVRAGRSRTRHRRRACVTGETVVYALPVDRDGQAVLHHLCELGFEVVIDPCADNGVDVLVGGPSCTREAVRAAIAEAVPPRLPAGSDPVRFEDE